MDKTIQGKTYGVQFLQFFPLELTDRRDLFSYQAYNGEEEEVYGEQNGKRGLRLFLSMVRPLPYLFREIVCGRLCQAWGNIATRIGGSGGRSANSQCLEGKPGKVPSWACVDLACSRQGRGGSPCVGRGGARQVLAGGPGDSPPRTDFPFGVGATFTHFHSRTISKRGTGGGQNRPKIKWG